MPSGTSITKINDLDADVAQEEWEHERHVDDGDHHQQDHETDRERLIALRGLGQLGQERRAGGGGQQEQADVDVLIEVHDLLDAPGQEGHGHEVHGQGQHDQTDVAERGDDLGDRQAQAHGQHRGDDEDQGRHLHDRAESIHVRTP